MQVKHPTNIDFPGGLKGVAEYLGDLRYDALAEFLGHFARKLILDSVKDKERGNAQLAEALEDTAISLDTAQRMAAKAWRISEPYMEPLSEPDERQP